MVNRLARALKEVAEAEHVYSFVFGDESDLHVVLAPRYAGTPGSTGAFVSPNGPAHRELASPRIRNLVARLRAHVISE